MAARTKPQMTEAEEREYEAKRMELYEDALHKPLDYVPHDTNTHSDDEMRDLVLSGGVEGLTDGLGAAYLYWCLMELLAQRPDHIYNVATDRGWQLLAIDLSTCGVFVTPDQCRALVARLIECRKLNAESFTEFHHISSNRISKNVHNFAEKSAQKALAGWRSGQVRDSSR